MMPVHISHDASALLGQQLPKSGILCAWSCHGPGRRQRGSMQPCLAMVTAPVSSYFLCALDLCPLSCKQGLCTHRGAFSGQLM